MKDNVLKKQFQEKDIQRVRNLVQGKHGSKTTIGTGYTKQTEFTLRVIFGKKMVVNGLLKMVSNKTLLN